MNKKGGSRCAYLLEYSLYYTNVMNANGNWLQTLALPLQCSKNRGVALLAAPRVCGNSSLDTVLAGKLSSPDNRKVVLPYSLWKSKRRYEGSERVSRFSTVSRFESEDTKII